MVKMAKQYLQAKMKRSMGGVDNGDLAEIEKRMNLKVVFRNLYLRLKICQIKSRSYRRAFSQLWPKRPLQYRLPKPNWNRTQSSPLQLLPSKTTNFLNSGLRQVVFTQSFSHLWNFFTHWSHSPSGQFYCAPCNLSLNSTSQFQQHQVHHWIHYELYMHLDYILIFLHNSCLCSRWVRSTKWKRQKQGGRDFFQYNCI